MKQATGKTNSSKPQIKVSIQLKLGGHSFSMESLPAIPTDEIEFAVLTHKTTLVPREEFEESLAATYLQLAGVACTSTEVPVWSDTQLPIIAVMAADAACIASLRIRFDSHVQFTSPLLCTNDYTTPTIWLYRTEGLLYIKVYSLDLRFAEVVIAETDADAVYYMGQLSNEFLFPSFTTRITGERNKELGKSLRNYFPQVLCE